MPLTIEVKPAVNVLADKSLNVSFPYNLDTVNRIKSMPVRHYLPDIKAWELPVEDLQKVIELFQDQPLVMRGSVRTQVKNVQTYTPAADKVDFAFKTEPFPHQVEGFKYAQQNDAFLLGDEQGLGKTKQAIDIAVSRKGQFKHCLIVCGVNSVKYNWAAEVKTHSNEKAHIIGSRINKKGRMVDGSLKERLADLQTGRDEFFLIINVESLRDKAIAAELKKLTQANVIGMVVVDEVHKCKNHLSQQGKALHHLKPKYKMALTGTPLMNSPMDLYNVMKWLGAEKSGVVLYRNQYCIMGGFGNNEIVGYKNLDQLQEKFAGVMLRRKKEDVLNLPPKLRSIEYVEMTPKQAQLYREVKDAIVANIDEIALNPNPLAQLIRLRQVTGHPGILSSTITESAKVNRLVELLEEIASSGKKAIVFSNWTDITSRILPALKQYNPAVVIGDTKDVEAEKAKFMQDPSCKVIVGTISKLGTGHTLTAATEVIFMDKPWNLANTEQAEDRAHRIGTTGTVNVRTIVCRDTIDERIEEIIAEKGDLAEALVDGKVSKLRKVELLGRLLA